MRQSKLLIPTLRETVQDSDSISYQMLVRAGYVRQAFSGVYSYLPLTYRVLEKINKIIKKELDKIGAFEIYLPEILPADLTLKNTKKMLDLIEFKENNEREYVLNPDYAVFLTEMFKNEINSYKRLPLFLYQIQKKYKEGIKSKLGLLQSKEYMVQDGYSFHDSEEGLTKSYQQVEKAYASILKQCGLDFKQVMGNSNRIESREAKEFMAFSDIGEESVCYSDSSDYASNFEIATSQYISKKSHEIQQQIEKIETPDVETIHEICEFLEIDPQKTIKSLLYLSEGSPIMVLVRGDHSVNPTKLKRYLQTNDLELATREEVKQYLGVAFGSIGPVSLPEEVNIYADQHVKDLANVVTGANETGFHFVNVNPERDFSALAYADFRYVQAGDISPDGEGQIQFRKAIKIGEIVKLGTLYSQLVNATILDQNGIDVPFVMGSYKIGISRLFAMIVEQNFDECGINWPKGIAPFDLHLVPIQLEDEGQHNLTFELEESLTNKGYQVLVDDRNERAGVKFTDADLIGIPIRITIGKKATEGIVEVKIRKTGEMIEVRKEDLEETITILMNQEESS